ncbi:MAG TPA: Eco29kI family restriction endonuclease [Hyalangium sp.]|jgi:hypothetical protein|nr:Eco29kI family restriction endonuclease [Hyalangium sp.]
MADKLDLEALREHLAALQKQVPTGEIDSTGFTKPQLKLLHEELEATIRRLEWLDSQLDPIKMPGSVFDPSDAQVVGKLIGDKLLEQKRVPLALVDQFYGSGVYALYYLGSFDAYAPISGTDTPIYVGKADPADRYAPDVRAQGDRLSRRLAEHRKSVGHAKNLKINDFDCRFLVVKTAWQFTTEHYLIDLFKPVWNSEMRVCYGFGKHGDSASTRGNTRSPWDTLHPGRPWATQEGNKPNRLGEKGIKKLIAAHFANHPPQYSEKIHPRRPK